MAPAPARRRIVNLLSYPKFQLMILANTIFSLAMVYGFTLLALRGSFQALRSTGEALALPQDHAYFKIFEMNYDKIQLAVALGFLVGVTVAVVGTLLLSHTMVGPLVRLKQYFEDLEKKPEGQRRPLTFRKGDFLHELAHSVNRGLSSIEGRSTEDRR